MADKAFRVELPAEGRQKGPTVIEGDGTRVVFRCHNGHTQTITKANIIDYDDVEIVGLLMWYFGENS